jgi:hypothetical protein
LSRTALVLAAAGLMVLPALAGAKPASFTVVGTQTAIHQKGAKINFTETLRQGSKVVGTDVVACTQTSNTILQCRGVFQLQGGTLVVSGKDNVSKVNNTIGITGGSGRYAGARGQLKLHSIGKTDRTQETFQFS